MNSLAVAAIRNWLLTSNVQIPEGPQKGGVAGWLDEKGYPAFVYAEATGYYLTGMAFMLAVSRTDENAVLNHAYRALAWLDRCCREGKIPLTRCYLSPHNHDWKNQVRFAFDLVMILRGVAAVRGLVAEEPRRRVQEALIGSLVPFREPGGSLSPFLPSNSAPAALVPARWSTTPGPYQLKIAASLLLPLKCEIPPELRDACEKIQSKWCRPLHSGGLTGEWHADLYFIEGLVLLGLHHRDSRAWALARESYQALMNRCEGSAPSLNAVALPEPAVRSDVIAQLLRAGCILRSYGYLGESVWAQRLNCLAQLLQHFITEEGAVSFGRMDLEGPTHWNAWCALFAYQALCFHEVVSGRGKLEKRWIQLLI